MALIKCPNCGKEYSEHADKCPKCRLSFAEAKEQRQQRATKRKKLVKTLFLIVISCGVLFYGGLLVFHQHQMKDSHIDGNGYCVYIMSNTGKTLKELPYSMYKNCPDFGFCVCQSISEHRYGCINTKGDVVLPFIYQKIIVTPNGSFFALEEDNKWCYISNTFEPLFTTDKYESIGDFSDGLAPVWAGGKVGRINESGEEVVAPEYDVIDIFANNQAIALKDKKYGVINGNGQVVVPFVYNHVYGSAKAAMLYDGGKIVYLKGNVPVDRNEIEDAYFPALNATLSDYYGKWIIIDEEEYRKHLDDYIQEITITEGSILFTYVSGRQTKRYFGISEMKNEYGYPAFYYSTELFIDDTFHYINKESMIYKKVE